VSPPGGPKVLGLPGMSEAMVEVDGNPLFDAERQADDEHATGDSEQLQEQPLAWCGVPTPSQPRGGNAVEPSQAEDDIPGIAGDSSQKEGRTNSRFKRRSRTIEIHSLAEWYCTPCDGPNPVFDEGDAEGHPEALPLTPASSLPTPTSVSGCHSMDSDTISRSRSSSPEPLSPSSHGAKRFSLNAWCIADGMMQSGRTPNTQDLCLRSPRARTPAASPARNASALPTLMGSPCGVSFGKLCNPVDSATGSSIEKFAAGATAVGGLSPDRQSRKSRGGGCLSLTPRVYGCLSMTPRVYTPRVWVSGGTRAQSDSCFAWQEVLSMFGSMICGIQSRCGGSSQGAASTVAPAHRS